LSERQPVRKWISVVGESVWLLHPEGYIARRQTQTVKKGTETTRTSRLERIPLPPALAGERTLDFELSLIAISEREAWLVDHTQRRLWRIRGSEWAGPWRIGEGIGDAATTPAGDLVVNTPSNPNHASERTAT
jgi:hypothetical protein